MIRHITIVLIFGLMLFCTKVAFSSQSGDMRAMSPIKINPGVFSPFSSFKRGYGPFLKAGLGISPSGKKDLGNIRLLSAGWQDEFYSLLDYQVELGGWVDRNKFDGRSNSLFLSVSPGISLFQQYTYVKLFFGPSLIGHTDSFLGGHFQFNTDIELGVKDNRGIGLGLNYKHMSSGGISSPNQGRDFISLKLQYSI